MATANSITRVSAIAVGAVAAMALSACSAGQITQTDSKPPVITGIDADAGDIALRDIAVVFPGSQGYEAGDNAPLRMFLSNAGQSPDALVNVSVEAADDVTIVTEESFLPPEPDEEPDDESGEDEDAAEEDAEDDGTDEGTEDEADEDGTEDEAAEDDEAADEDGTADDIVTGSSEVNVELAPSNRVAMVPETEFFLQLEGLHENFLPGNTIEVVFDFESGESVTVPVPMETPADPQERECIDVPRFYEDEYECLYPAEVDELNDEA